MILWTQHSCEHFGDLVKVLFVDMQYDYGEKSRGLNSIGILGFKKAFENLGHETVPFYYDDYLTSSNESLQADL